MGVTVTHKARPVKLLIKDSEKNFQDIIIIIILQ